MKSSCDISEDSINELKDGEYILKDCTAHVRAATITYHQQSFLCPFCRDRFRNDGMPYKRSKPVTTHYHSFDPKDTSVTLHTSSTRLPHCGPRYNSKGIECRTFPKDKCNQFCIHITDKTKRDFRTKIQRRIKIEEL